MKLEIKIKSEDTSDVLRFLMALQGTIVGGQLVQGFNGQWKGDCWEGVLIACSHPNTYIVVGLDQPIGPLYQEIK